VFVSNLIYRLYSSTREALLLINRKYLNNVVEVSAFEFAVKAQRLLKAVSIVTVSRWGDVVDIFERIEVAVGRARLHSPIDY